MIRRRRIVAGAAALAAFLVISSCANKDAPGAAAPNPASGAQRAAQQGGAAPQGGRRIAATAVQATVVQVGQLSASRDTAGVISPVTQSQVAAGASGIVSEVLRDAGAWVAAGEVVVRLDDSSLKIALANAEAALESATIALKSAQESASQSSSKLRLQVDSAQAAFDAAKRYYEAQKALFDLGGISASALDSAKAQMASAEASLESARLSLDQNERGIASTPSQSVEVLRVAVKTAENNLAQARYNLRNAAVRAPFAGQIASVSAAPGMYLGQNGTAFTLVSAERQVTFTVAPADVAAVPPGKELGFEIGTRTYPIKVRQAPSLPVNGVVSLAASMRGASELPFGTVGKVSYVVPLARGVLVPIGCLDTLDNRNFVYLVEGGKATIRDVSVIAQAGAVAAVAGIDAGATVVLSPPPGLVEGAPVQPTMIPSSSGRP